MLMVWPASKSSSTPQPQLLLFLLYTTGCFLLSMPRPALVAAAPFSFSFDFSSKSTYHLDDLQFEGDAALNGDLIDLTCKTPIQTIGNNCTGRMSYNHPVRFYDDATGEVASFSTRFTFAIKPNKDGGGERGGMAFFLSGYPSRLSFSSSGSNLGLDDIMTDLDANRFVAVEFDTYGNSWDPMGTKDHIGIDINTVRSSVNTTSLPRSSLNGTMTATISFDSTTKMLIAYLHLSSLETVQVSTRLPDDVISLLPPEVAVGFSAATGTSFDFHQIMSWSFNSTLATPQKIKGINGTTETPGVNGPGINNFQPKQRRVLAGEETPGANNPTQQQAPAPPSGEGSGSSTAAAIIAGAILLAPVVLVVWFILSWCMWKHAGNSYVRKAGLGDIPRYDYHDLVKATDKFSEKNLLGTGSFGKVYKGILKKKRGGKQEERLAVKQIKEPDASGATKSALGVSNTFVSELKITWATRHKNLVKLKGWCYCRIHWKLFNFVFCRKQATDIFLVYELVPNGSLHDHLRSGANVLPWEKRYEIVKGIGLGLHYLHDGCGPRILHRDIKPSNILLDDDFTPKLADFGLSRIANQNNTIPSTLAMGTVGYMDPLCMKNGNVRFGPASDVYSFGVVLLDIASCSQKTIDQFREMYRRNGLEKFLEDAADVNLHGAFDKMQMKQLLVLGLWCCFLNATQRPSMEEAMKVLDNYAPLLNKGIQILEHGKELRDEQIIENEGEGNASNMTSPDGQWRPLIPPSSKYKPCT